MVTRSWSSRLASLIWGLTGAAAVGAGASAVGSAARALPQQPPPAGVSTPAAGPAATDSPPVRIDAVVTDHQGRAILDLRPSDFELLEDGNVRPTGTIELRAVSRAGAVDTAPIETERDEQRAARQPGTRVFAFFLDEFHVTPGAGADRARAALTRFVDEQLAPQDLALVVKPLDPLHSLRFTRDRAALRAAIAGFGGRKGDVAPRTPFEEQYIGRAAAAVNAARTQIVTAGLRELTLRLGELQADRGVVVLVSEGFARDNPAPRSPRGQDLQGVVRASGRFHLSIYTFNPASPAEDASSPAERERAVGTLQWLAVQTGGRAVVAPDDLPIGLKRMADDLAAYYALTYQPAQADGKFHTMEVRAKRRNAEVRARPGYWAPLGGEWRALVAAASAMPPLSRRALRRSSLVDTWVGLVSDAGGRARMVVSWEPHATASAPHVVAVKARTTTGAALFDGEVARVQSGSAILADSARFDVPAGRVELELTVLDVQGKVLDTDVRDFDVPDLRAQKRGPMLLFPAVVRARTLREFREASADPNAAPASVRTFARGDRLLIRVPAFDSSGAAVEVRAKVLNEWGQPMRDIESVAGAAGDRVSQFALPLSWLVPGQYLIEVSGTNANGAVRERLTFRVTG